MFFSCHRQAGHLRLALGVLCLPSCASETLAANAVEVRTSRLELECTTVPADKTGDVTSILSSVEPLDPLQPQAYGSEQCAGVSFEFDNPEAEALRGAWIQAGGESSESADVLGDSLCPERVVQADYWGYEKREWSKLASTSSSGAYEPNEAPGTGYCHLEALLEHAGAFEKLRIVARVTQGSDTYPMYATVW